MEGKLKKGFWKPEEDLILKKYVESNGEGNWSVVSKKSGKVGWSIYGWRLVLTPC